MKLIFAIAIMFVAAGCWAQTYTARTDLTAQPYPGTIPCPGPSCTGGGALSGANYQFTPSDFATPLVRMTDASTGGASGVQHTFNTSCDAGSEVNDWNMLDNRVTICRGGNWQQLWAFDTSTNQFSQSTSFVSPPSGTSMYFSYTQPYLAYHLHLNSSNDLAVFSYDTTCAGGITTCNPSPVQVVDIGTACSIAGLTGNASAGAGTGITVSGDDQTFGVLGESTPGQSSSGDVYVIAWNRTTGCEYWNTGTGHWFINGVDQGTVSLSDRFTVHNMRLAKGGGYMKVALGVCLTTCPITLGNYFWTIGSSTVYASGSNTNACGHSASGYTKNANKCDGAIDVNGMFVAPFTAPDTLTSLPSAYPSPEVGK